MLLELLDHKRDRILEAKNICYSQIDILIEQAITTIKIDIKKFKRKVINHFVDLYETSSAVDKIKHLELMLKDNSKKQKAITSSSIVDSAKKEMMAKLNVDKNHLNIKLVELKHKQIMAFNYPSGLKLFLQQIKDYKQCEAKDLFLCIMAIDRENLNIILKLSNKPDYDINYNQIMKSTPLYKGNYYFVQTRLHLKTQWKLFLT